MIKYESVADRWRIGVMGLTPGAGTSLLTVCMAGYFAEGGTMVPAVAELGGGGIYDSMGMDRHFALREFYSFYKAASGSANIRNLTNLEKGVNWALKLPAEREERIGYREALRLIYGISGDVIFFDFSGRQDEELWLLLKEMDMVIAVIDPMPERLLAGRGTLERWKLSGLPLHYVINKDNKGIDQKELMRYLKLREAERVPWVRPEALYSAQYDGQNPWDSDRVKEMWKPVFDRLFEEIR